MAIITGVSILRFDITNGLNNSCFERGKVILSAFFVDAMRLRLNPEGAQYPRKEAFWSGANFYRVAVGMKRCRGAPWLLFGSSQRIRTTYGRIEKTYIPLSFLIWLDFLSQGDLLISGGHREHSGCLD